MAALQGGAGEDDSEEFISTTSFALRGHTFIAGDFLFLHSQATEQLPGAGDLKGDVPEYAYLLFSLLTCTLVVEPTVTQIQ